MRGVIRPEARAGTAGRAGPAGGVALFVLFASLQFVTMETFLDFPFPYMYPRAFFVSCVAFSLLVALFASAFRSMRAGFLAVGVLGALEGTVSRYLSLIRDAPLMFTDLASIRTAADVAKNYDYTPDLQMWVMWCVSLVLVLVTWFGHKEFGAADRWFSSLRWPARALSVLGLAACLFGIGVFVAHDYSAMLGRDGLDSLSLAYSVNSRRQAGTIYDFIGMPYVNRPVEPDGYGDWEQASDAFDFEPADPVDMPDVVVIMDEAFSDPDDWGASCALSDYMPFLHSFGSDANSRLGKLDVSVKAGNTANTEFEYLCGSSLAWYVPRSVPYQYAIKRDVPSLARYLSAMGYETWAVHPASGENWMRSEVYKKMGFDKCVFDNESCDGVAFAPWTDRWDEETDVIYMMQDTECLEAVKSILSKREDDGIPRFVFVVTIQNHGGYFRLFQDLDLDVMIDADAANLARPDDELAMVKYLSLMKKSDGAYAELAAWLSDREADEGFGALTAFFGDHQPDSTAHVPFSRAGGVDEHCLSPDQIADQYVVPYGIWATYGLPEDLSLGRKSVGYAGIDLFMALGRGMPEYYSFLSDMLERVPVQTGVRVETDGSDEAAALLEEYKMRLWQRIQDPDYAIGGGT